MILLVISIFGEDGSIIIPDNVTWAKAEQFCLKACEQHQQWVIDLDEDFSSQESVVQ